LLVEAQVVSGFNTHKSLCTHWEVHDFIDNGYIGFVDVVNCWNPFGLDGVSECGLVFLNSLTVIHDFTNNFISEILVSLSSISVCAENLICVIKLDGCWGSRVRWSDMSIFNLHVPGIAVHVTDFLRVSLPSLGLGLEFRSGISGFLHVSLNLILDFPVES